MESSSSSSFSGSHSIPKTLPMKYKAMLYANIQFIHNYIPVKQRSSYYDKLPLYKSIEEQIRYFDIHCDIETIESKLYNPMMKEHNMKRDQDEREYEYEYKHVSHHEKAETSAIELDHDKVEVRAKEVIVSVAQSSMVVNNDKRDVIETKKKKKKKDIDRKDRVSVTVNILVFIMIIEDIEDIDECLYRINITVCT